MKVKLITWSVLMPMSEATDGFQETARMAVPMREWKMIRCSMSIIRTDTPMQMRSMVLICSPAIGLREEVVEWSKPSLAHTVSK